MTLRNMRAGFALAASAAVLGAFVTTAQATPFNQALVSTYDAFTTGSGNCGNPTYHFNCNFVNTSPSVTATQGSSQSGPGFSDTTYAQANLATGTLKVRAAASGDGNEHPYAQANATFGDGFTTTFGNSPFVWNSATATFNLNFGASNLLQETGDTSANAFVILGIDKKGSVNAGSNWFTGSDTITYFLYEIGAQPQTIYYNGTQLTTTKYFTSVPSSVSASFQPGQDFDWVVLFGASGQIGGDPENGGGSYDYDLSHTLALNYVAPDDTTTVSDSGIFDSQSEVPEPLTLSIFAAGLAGAVSLRRRRANKA